MKEFKNAIFYFLFKLMQVMLARNESQMGLCLGKDCIFKTKSRSDFKHYFHTVFFLFLKRIFFGTLFLSHFMQAKPLCHAYKILLEKHILFWKLGLLLF
jgi:hypothetical protein